jgi:hypothetical protein
MFLDRAIATSKVKLKPSEEIFESRQKIGMLAYIRCSSKQKLIPYHLVNW